jgi:hypothetical protein
MSYEEEDTCQSILVSLACLAWTQPSRFVQQGSRRGIFFCLIFFNFLLSSHRDSRSRRGMAVLCLIFFLIFF